MSFAMPTPGGYLDILIIEPEDTASSTMQLLFKNAGLVAYRVPDAESARKVLRDNFPHCLVISEELPELSGISFLNAIRNEGNDIPAVIVAKRGDVKNAVAAMRAGAADFLEKPFLDARLLLAARKLITRFN